MLRFKSMLPSSEYKFGYEGLLQNLEVCNSPFERKNGGAGGCVRTLRLHLKIPRF